MINSDPNMSRKQILTELPIPSDDAIKKPVSNNLLYKAVFVAIKLLLDIRLNLVKISEGKQINTRHKVAVNKPKESNPVIKDTDNIK